MKLPEVLQVEKETNIVKLTLYVDARLDCFRGHFDIAPIVPGVVQLGWAIEYCSRYLRTLSALDIERVEALKFQQIIQPGGTVELGLELHADKLLFSITANDIRHSSGKVVIS